MATQLELQLADQPETNDLEGRTLLPEFVIVDETTPGDLLRWWDDLVAIFTSEMERTKANAEPLTAELAKLKGQRTTEARRRAAKLREQRELLFARAEDTEFRAYALFEQALTDFTPRLKELLRAGGVAVEADDDSAIADFWDCLQRPAIEHYASLPLREIAKRFCCERNEPTA